MSVSTARLFVRAFALLLLPALMLGGLLMTSPAQAQRITPSFWGMHDNDWTTPPGVPVGSANFTTAGTYWRNIEKANGVYDWARLDSQVAAAEAIGARPMIVLGSTPQFHSSRAGSADYYTAMPDVAAWRRYVGQVAARYGARLDYQIWPEPNIVQNWTGTPRQMAKLTVVAAKAIRQAAGKRPRIVSPAVALRLDSQQAWTMKYFKQRVGGKRVDQYLNAIAIDPFPLQTGTPELSYGIMKKITKRLAHIGVTKPIWNNEINYGVAGGGATTTTTYPMPVQQSYVIRTYVLSAAAKMQRAYWLGWFASPQLGINMANSQGAALPPATSYRVVRSWLNGTNFQGCSKKRGLWTCTTKAKGEVRRIYWKPSGVTVIKTPASTRRVENQDGNVDARRGAHKVAVDYRPIMVASAK